MFHFRPWLVRVAALLLLGQATNLAVMPVALCCRSTATPAGADGEMACCKKGAPGHACHLAKTRAGRSAVSGVPVATRCVLRSGCADPETAWVAGLVVAPLPASTAVVFHAPVSRVVRATRPFVLDLAPSPTTPPPRA